VHHTVESVIGEVIVHTSHISAESSHIKSIHYFTFHSVEGHEITY